MTEVDQAIIEEASTWYDRKRASFEDMTRRLHTLLIDVLKDNAAPHITVASRVKEKDSFLNKFKKEKKILATYHYNDMHDIVGLRVITLLRSQRNRVGEAIKDCFEIDPNKSGDRGVNLGADRVGYRAIHWIARLNEPSATVPGLKICKDRWFEIQVCSILEYGFSEFNHDNVYKQISEVPTEIVRDFYLCSSVIEFVDRRFDELAIKVQSKVQV